MSVPPAGIVRFEASAIGDTIAGYAKVLGSAALNGSALFKTFSGDKLLSEAGVGIAHPAKNFTVYIDNLNNAVSGYAVANYGYNTANMALTLRDKDGKTKDSALLSLPAGRHVAEFAFQRFPNTETRDFEGSIEFAGDENVAAVALRYDNAPADVFSTIPVLVDETARTLYFPQVADGGGYITDFILVNATEAETTARVEFFDDAGRQWNLPIGGVQRAIYEVVLAPRGVVHFVSDGTSIVTKVGWAKVTSPVAIGGSAIFQTVNRRIMSEAGVASSPPANHLVTYVDSTGYVQSGVALCNPSPSAVTVTLHLRDATGQVVSSRQISLPPLGHVAKFFTDQVWFPEARGFEGTLEIISTGAVAGVALRYDNPGGTVFATLPMIVMP